MTPRLSIGLPVYNGQEFLGEALDALLGQTFTDFEVVISDNASTDSTPDICRDYVRSDSRVRYFRQPANIGAAPNHAAVLDLASAQLFKWASHDDLYAPTLLDECVRLLDRTPDAVLAHSWKAFIDEHGEVLQVVPYELATDSPSTARRFAALLFGYGGDDFYGVIRTDVLRRVKPHGSHHHADHTFVAELALHGRFVQVPEVLYFRRDHADRAERSATIRQRCINLDPQRADGWQPPARLVAEYPLGYLTSLWRAPLSPAERVECVSVLAGWGLSRAVIPRSYRRRRSIDPANLAKAAAVA